MPQDKFSLGNILQKDIEFLLRGNMEGGANEELRGEQADFEVTDISTTESRFAMGTSQRSQEDCTNSDYSRRNNWESLVRRLRSKNLHPFNRSWYR